MTVVTVAGHGGWDRETLKQRGESNWVNAAPVPVYFFTENMKSMWGMAAKNASLDEADILATMDEADLLRLVDDGLYSRMVAAGSGCLNYVVGDDETSDDLVAGDGVILHHGGEYSLQNLFDTYSGASAIFWCCCSAIMLDEAGGSELGVDETQSVFDTGTGEYREAWGSDQADWKGLGDFEARGVEQCDRTCPTCSNRCRLGTDHIGSYDHQCDQGHGFSEDDAALGIDRLLGDTPLDQAPRWQDDPDWQAFVERLVTADPEAASQMWAELGYDTQAMLREDERVQNWAAAAGV
ncbi:MAG: hypothetical protein ACRD0D_12415 [Acidimicrobiales bacterium]